MQIREQLQSQSDRLTTEVSQLRKQLADSLDIIRRPDWMRGGSVGGGQRISEISIDLVSESDECADDDNKATDAEDRAVSSERLIVAMESKEMLGVATTATIDSTTTLQQIEQFQRFLSSDERRIFFMVQNKFNEYLCDELAKVRGHHEGELKILGNSLEAEKHEKETEVSILQKHMNV